MPVVPSVLRLALLSLGVSRAFAQEIAPVARLAPIVPPAAEVSAPPLPALSQIALLKSPMESVDARANLIPAASSSVYASYFTVSPDAAGLTQLALLRDAARRGLDVRLIFDAVGGKEAKLPVAMIRHLVDEGVQVRLFHPPRLARLPWIWRRMHDKLTIVDGERMILGDSNLADHFFGMGPRPYRSREAYVAGAAARAAARYAERMWDSRAVGKPRGLEKAAPEDVAAAARRLDAFARNLDNRRASPDDGPRPWERRARTAPVFFTHNDFERPGSVPGTGADLLRMIRRARRTIVIENAYVVLPKAFKKELARAIRERGVRVVMVTNSRATNNLATVRFAYAADVPELVDMGVELYEFDGPGTLHAKSVVVDGERAYLGSYNLDPRSFRLNTETGVVVVDRGFAGDLLAEIEETRASSTLVGLNRVPMTAPRSRAAARLRRLPLLVGRGQI